MKGSTHLTAGLLAGALVAAGTGTPISTEMAGYLAVSGIAGLFPDWIQINIPGGSQAVKGFFGHRGFSHTLLAAVLVWIVMRLGFHDTAWYALAGWLSHVVIDTFSGGCRLLWPWSYRIVLAKIKTGGQLDTFVGAAMLVLSVVLIGGLI